LDHGRINMRYFIFWIFNFYVFSVFAQRITNFNLYGVGRSVGLSFTITKGSTCSGYIVWHSLDSLNFTMIEDYQGMCSSSFEDYDNSYTHSNPMTDHFNYYKVEIAIGEVSEVKSIYVSSKSTAGLILYPNPLDATQDVVNLKALATANGQLTGFINDSMGKKYESLNLITYDTQASFSVAGYRNGIYFIWLTDGELMYSGKFILLR